MGDVASEQGILPAKRKLVNALNQDTIPFIEAGNSVVIQGEWPKTDEVTIEDFAKEFPDMCQFLVGVEEDLPQRLANQLVKKPIKADSLLVANLKNGTGFLKENISQSNLADIKQFIMDFQTGKLIKSEERPEKDMDPDHPGLTVLTRKSFDEIALDPDTECFVDIYADWCGPCVAFKPALYKLANVLQGSGIKICKFNTELNQKVEEFMPETSIPVLKFIPKGDREQKLK